MPVNREWMSQRRIRRRPPFGHRAVCSAIEQRWTITSLRRVVAAIVLIGAATSVTACTEQEPSPSVTSTPSSTPRPPTEPAIVPDGSAEDNRTFFDEVNADFLQAARMPGGRALIDNLVANGFDRLAMQVTPDETAIGQPADSIQFSVRVGDQCLIGQTSEAIGYIGAIGPTVDGTDCLPGVTRPIDW